MNEPLRKALLAGSWYPGHPKKLIAEIEFFFDHVPDQDVLGDVVGLIAPHAGYAYSGQVAASAYKLVRGQDYDAVIVIGPSHRVSFRGVSVFNGVGYETPLGMISVHTELADAIVAQSTVTSTVAAPHRQECNAIEIHLPFLQVALGQLRFVPLIMADQDAETCNNLTEAIVHAVGCRKVLLVASSDLSHDHPYDMAVEMDRIAIRHMEKMDADGLLKDLAKGVIEACGGGPAAVVMMVAKRLGADGAKILEYANSGDVTGDKQSRIVGYAAAVYYHRHPAADAANRAIMNGNEINGQG